MAPYNKLLVGIDFSSHSESALVAAQEVAKQSGAQVVAVHALNWSRIWGDGPGYDLSAISIDEGLKAAMKKAQNQLDEWVVQKSEEVGVLSSHKGVSAKARVELGHPPGVMEKIAEEEQADLIIVASQGLSAVPRAILGSVTTQVIKQAKCPVLVVGSQRHELGAIKKILAVVDLSPVTKEVIEQARMWAVRSHAKLDVLSVFDEPLLLTNEQLFRPERHDIPMGAVQQADQLKALNATIQHIENEHNQDDVAVEGIVIPGSPPYVEILNSVGERKADLLVVGRSGHSNIEKALLGTNITKIAAEASVPVLVVPRVEPSEKSSEAPSTAASVN